MMHISPLPLPETRGLVGKAWQVTSDRGGLDSPVFFAVHDGFADLVAPTDEAILALGGILGLVRGEDVTFTGMAVDPLYLRNVRAALRQFSAWYPEFKSPALDGLDPETVRPQPASGVASFLSGGIDSQFTLQRHSDGNARQPESAVSRDITHALHIFHTPEPVAPDAADALGALARSAERQGAAFVTVYSNLMTFDRTLNDRWSDVGHGAGLASVLHFLAGGVGTGLIGSTHSFGGLMPWGSSPITDPLWSGNRLRVVHDGSTYTRVEKTAVIAGNDAMLAGINVCDTRVEGEGYVNCSQCQKCLRTMITLDLLGKADADACPSFDWTDYTPAKFGNVLLHNTSEASFAREIRDAAMGQRADIVAACDAALWRGKWLAPLSKAEQVVKKSAFGRRNRARLKRGRDRLYKTMGWATKPTA